MGKIILEISQPYSTTAQRFVATASRVVVGRGYDCDVILDDPYVSENHFEVTLLAEGRFLVTDKGSVNGVFKGLEKMPNEPFAIESGQEIKVGRTHIKLFSPQHAVPPTRLHDRLSALQNFMDRRWIGIVLSCLCIAAGIALYRLTDADNPEYWRVGFYSTGAMILFFIAIMWSVVNISLVVFSKKHIPWPRIVSYVSVVLFMFMTFSMLLWPYIDFYLLSDWQALATGVGLLFIFLVAAEYGYRIIFEIPLNLPKLLFFSMVAALLLSLPFYEFGYSDKPAFPKTIITVDVPLWGVQPLDGFIERTLAREIK